jgi:hypothetical protein
VLVLEVLDVLLEEVEETLVVVTVEPVVVVVLDDPPPAVVVVVAAVAVVLVVADGSKTEVGGGQADADSRVSMANRALGSLTMRVMPNSIPI